MKSSNAFAGREHDSRFSRLAEKRKVAATRFRRRHASRDSRLYRSAAIAPWPSSDERFAVLAATCPSPTRWRALLQTDTGVPLPWFCFVCSRLVLCYANLPEQGTSIVPSAWILCYAPNNIDGAKQLPLKRRILSEWTTTI
jgi:hypothetical protein